MHSFLKFPFYVKNLTTQETVIKTYRISFILCTSFLYTILNLKVLFNKIYNQQQSDLTTINYFDRTLHNWRKKIIFMANYCYCSHFFFNLYSILHYVHATKYTFLLKIASRSARAQITVIFALKCILTYTYTRDSQVKIASIT